MTALPIDPSRGTVAPGRVIAHAPESTSAKEELLRLCAEDVEARVIAAACVVRHAPTCGPRSARALRELADAVDALEASLADRAYASEIPDERIAPDPSSADPSRLARDTR